MNTETLQKAVVHISRHWHNPAIAIELHSDGIKLECTLEDFCRAIVAEIAHPAFVLRRSTLEANVLAAVEPVLNKIKQSTVHT